MAFHSYRIELRDLYGSGTSRMGTRALAFSKLLGDLETKVSGVCSSKAVKIEV